MAFKSKKQRSWEDEVSISNAKTYLKKRQDIAQTGGKLFGPSHKNGGIDINVEGEEIIINKTENNAAGKHEDKLLALNKNPDAWEIVPTKDARKRGKVIA